MFGALRRVSGLTADPYRRTDVPYSIRMTMACGWVGSVLSVRRPPELMQSCRCAESVRLTCQITQNMWRFA